MTKDQAIDKIILAANKLRATGLIHYAATYANAARHMTGEEWRVQCLYILNNLSGWRGDEAKAVKEFLKQESRA
jgi:hypothetical protein